jgi:hypothetical protein
MFTVDRVIIVHRPYHSVRNRGSSAAASLTPLCDGGCGHLGELA